MNFNSIRRLAITTFSKKIYYKRPRNYLYLPHSINFVQRQVYFSTQPSNIKEFVSQTELEEEEDVIIDKSLYPELFPEEKEHNDADDAWFVDPAYENLQKSEDFVPLWQKKAVSLSDDVNKYKLMESDDFQKTKSFDIVRFLEEEGIEKITVIDVRQKCDFTDWMIIGEGKTTRHLGGAVDGLYKMLKDETKIQNFDQTNSSPQSYQSYPIVEGRDSEDWMLIDTGSIFVHLFTPEARKYRNLEGLWEKVPPRSASEEGVKNITDEMIKEFKEFNPKFTRNPPLPPEL